MHSIDGLTSHLKDIGEPHVHDNFTRFREVEGTVADHGVIVKTSEQVREGERSVWTSMYEYFLTRGLQPNQALNRIAHSMQDSQPKTQVQESLIGTYTSLESLLASSLAQALIESKVESELRLQGHRVDKDKLSILPSEIQSLEATLRSLDILPPGFGVYKVAMRGDIYKGQNDVESSIYIDFNLLPLVDRYPLLASHAKDVLPSTSIRNIFRISMNLVQLNQEGARAYVELIEPDSTDLIFWSNFTKDELDQFIQEIQTMRHVVQEANMFLATSVSVERLQPLIDRLIDISKRISKRVRE